MATLGHTLKYHWQHMGRMVAHKFHMDFELQTSYIWVQTLSSSIVVMRFFCVCGGGGVKSSFEISLSENRCVVAWIIHTDHSLPWATLQEAERSYDCIWAQYITHKLQDFIVLLAWNIAQKNGCMLHNTHRPWPATLLFRKESDLIVFVGHRLKYRSVKWVHNSHAL